MEETDNSTLRVFVNGEGLDLPRDGLDGRAVLAAVGAEPADRDILIRIDGGWARLLAPSDPVVPIDGEARFRVHRNASLRYVKVDDRVWEWGASGIDEQEIREIAGIPPERILHEVGGEAIRPGATIDLTVDWVPAVVSRPGQASRQLTVPITVNGRQTALATAEVSFEDLVQLAYPDSLPTVASMFTVSFRHGPADQPEGVLAPRQRMRAMNGVVYNVTATSKS